MPDAIERLTAALADRYRIERELGAGGMATVYLAEDLKHERKVALKVLKPELAAVLGADRFVQEIKTTASLQHPHILPLFDSGQADGFLYYVMPYIEGETLREKLDRETQLGIDESIRITIEVADALDYAHRNGVIHRDIKPENILLHDGRPMVADFGIALAVSAAAGGRMTETGLSLGTPHYMSPEQATAEKDITNRSDIYSLACMTYEMLAGDPPHTGSTAQQIIMKIVTEEATAVTNLRKSVPPNVAAALTKALEKLPADRFASARAFADALGDAAFTSTVRTDEKVAPRLHTLSSARALAALGAFLALTTLLALWGWLRPMPEPVARYGLAFAAGQEWADLVDRSFALAPDGSKIVYVGPGEGRRRLWVKGRDQYEAQPLAGTEGAREPVISPDGRWILYRVDTSLKKIPIGGGSAITIADSAVAQYGGAAWLDDGTIVYTGVGYHVRRVAEAGGSSEAVWRSDTADRYALVQAPLPGGRGALFTLCNNDCRSLRELWVMDLRSNTARLLLPNISAGRYVETGHLVYVRNDGGVFAVPFDLGALEIRGAAVPVLEGVSVDAGIIADFEIAANGTLLYSTKSGPTGPGELVWVTREGNASPVDTGWTGNLRTLAISPDGARLAVSILTEDEEQLWIKQLPNGPLAKLTFEGSANYRPTWTPDGRSVVFVSDRGSNYDLYAKQADGSGRSELLVDRERGVEQADWSSDGSWLVFRDGGADGQRDILGLRPGIDTTAVALLTTPFEEYEPTLSPDGKWLAYVSNEAGQTEVLVRPFPNTSDARWLISNGGGNYPRWAHSGRQLFYVGADGNMIAAEVQTDPMFSVGERHTLFGTDAYRMESAWHPAYDVAPDDQRFLMIRRGGAAATGRLVLVINWIEELKEKVRQ